MAQPSIESFQAPASSSSSSSPHNLKFLNLPYYLKNCLTYCCIFPDLHRIRKGKLIRLLVAEGLVQENGDKVPEAVAEQNIDELTNLGMLQVDKSYGSGTNLFVVPPYHELCLHKAMDGEHFITIWNSTDSSVPYANRRVSFAPDITKIMSNSLFLMGNTKLPEEEGNWLNLSEPNLLQVLDLEKTKIKKLPDEVGDLTHLTYLGLKHTDITELPETIGDLQALQTLDVRWCGMLEDLPNTMLSLVRLRHLKMYKNSGVRGMKVPEGIGRLRDLQTLTGIYAGGGTAEELGQLIQLRRLGVMDVADDHIHELFGSIMKMESLLSLSLEAKHTFSSGKLVILESFTPPPLLEKLRLGGCLDEMPNWVASMNQLTKLYLSFSHLSESPMPVLEGLPNLKILTLWHAYDARQIGREFCRMGGFPKLEDLSIASRVLEEWTELEEGALPSLKCLHIRNCLQLRMLPDGLQFVTTLEELNLLPLLDVLAEKLRPDGGPENYKIKNIASVSFLTTSSLLQRARQDSG